jgi:hypothetical protein
VDQDAIIQYVIDAFMGVKVVGPTDGLGAGDTFSFYDPQRVGQPRRHVRSSGSVKATTRAHGRRPSHYSLVIFPTRTGLAKLKSWNPSGTRVATPSKSSDSIVCRSPIEGRTHRQYELRQGHIACAKPVGQLVERPLN